MQQIGARVTLLHFSCIWIPGKHVGWTSATTLPLPDRYFNRSCDRRAAWIASAASCFLAASLAGVLLQSSISWGTCWYICSCI